MQRRDFIKGLAALSLLPAWSACKKEVEPNGKVVVVIGAGISGLAAAKTLQENGFTVIVLEAQDRVGGRLRTNRTLGVAFDEGASWIHGIRNNPITQLARKAGGDTFYTNDSSLVAYDLGGTKYSEDQYSETEAQFEQMLETLMNQGSAQQSVQEVFQAQYPQQANDRLYRALVSAFLTFDTGDLDLLSSLYYNEGEVFGGPEHIFTNGYDTIPHWLAESLDVRFNESVQQISYTDTGAQITTAQNSYTCDYVVVSVPLGVLKNQNIAFQPTLPADKTTAIGRVGMNCVNKFLLVWDQPFWDKVQYLVYTPEIADQFNYFVNVNHFHPDTAALMTFAYADAARATETMTDEQVIAAIMLHLRDMYGASTPEPTAMLRTRWQSNPYTFGSYSYTAVGMELSDFDALAAPIQNRVFFAGEHTHRDYFSTAHGAYLSGIRAAEEIIDVL